MASAALFVVAVALLGAGLVYLGQASAIATGGYDVLRLEAERGRLIVANRQLSYKLAELSALTRVEAEARERLEMTPPESLVFLKAR